LAQVYQRFAQKFDSDTSGVTQVAVASDVDVTAKTGYLPLKASLSGVASTPSRASLLTGGYRPDLAMSSTFATMLIAQMDLGSLSSTTPSTMYANDDDQKKKSALSMLSAVG
jgi:hypothetical protein